MASLLGGTSGLTKQISRLGALAGQTGAGGFVSPLALAPYLAPDKTVGMTPVEAFGDNVPGKQIGMVGPGGAFADDGLPGGPTKLTGIDLGGLYAGTTAEPSAPPPSAPGTDNSVNLGGDWAGVERWSSQIAAAAAKYGVPANLIKAIMRVESNGEPNATGAPGVWGPMQVYGEVWGYGPWMSDPAANIDKGVQILKGNYDQYGSWDMATQAYLGFGTDQFGTTNTTYRDRVFAYWDQLNAASAGAGAGLGYAPQPARARASLETMFGPGAGVPDWGEFDAPSDLGYYGYSAQYGLSGFTHTGLDIPMGGGAPMRAAFSGTVTCAGTGIGNGTDGGGCSNFNYVPNFAGAGGAMAGSGRVEILSDDGNTMLIYGHSAGSAVRPGQRVNAGDLVAYNGGMNSSHVHLEARVRDPSMPLGWRIVDPRTVLGAAPGAVPAASSTGGASGPVGFRQNLMDFVNAWRGR